MNKLFLIVINFYQYFISPLLGQNCRFYPSCSEYCKQCFEQFTFFKALWYSLKRILRCNKFFRGGYDPVPKEDGDKK